MFLPILLDMLRYITIITMLLSGCGDFRQRLENLKRETNCGIWGIPCSSQNTKASSFESKFFDETCKRGECPAVDLSLIPSQGMAADGEVFDGIVNIPVKWSLKFKSTIKHDRVMITIKEVPIWMSTLGRWVGDDFHLSGKPDKTDNNGTVKIFVRDLSRCFALEKDYRDRCKYLGVEFPDYEESFTFQFKIKANPAWPSP